MKTILVVEDDNLVRKVMEIRLAQMIDGIKVVSASDGLEAIQKIKELNPVLILLDLVLPGKNGFDVLETLAPDIKTGKLTVIALSNLSSKPDIERAMRLGAKSYFVKSNIDISNIVKELKKMI